MSTGISFNIQQQVKKGVTILRKGGVIAYPTDTVYGLGAGLKFTRAIERVYEVKERPRNMALPLLLADYSQLADLANSMSPLALTLAHAFWPGALTLVLPALATVPNIITAGGKTVAVRIPAHPIPVTLVKELRMPIVGTSANLSGQPSPLTAEEVYAQLGDKVDFIIDGGRCAGGKESTIIDVSGEKPVLLREGAIPRTEIERVIGKSI
jgi:L-threonylcarbamoyladenylate synthase